MASSSKTTLWGKPTLLVQVTESPALMVMVAGSNTRAPPSPPSFTLAALAERASPREVMPTPAALAHLNVTRERQDQFVPSHASFSCCNPICLINSDWLPQLRIDTYTFTQLLMGCLGDITAIKKSSCRCERSLCPSQHNRGNTAHLPKVSWVV